MTKAADFAHKLNGRQISKEVTREEDSEANSLGLLVVFGSSDDLCEFRGVLNDEVGAGDGTITRFRNTKRGLDFIEEEEDHEVLLQKGWTPPEEVFHVITEWCPDNIDTAWNITTNVPEGFYNNFHVLEGDETYCVGIVIDVNAYLKWRDDVRSN